jgi:predicted DNA-binding transcriptional regulator YafY
VRVFRLDRVLEVETRAETFTRPADFDSLAAVERALATMPGTWPAEVALKTTPAEARRLTPSTLGVLEPDQDGVTLRCEVADLDWLAHFLVGLGCPFAVRRPPELVAALERLGERIAGAVGRAGDEAAPPTPG